MVTKILRFCVGCVGITLITACSTFNIPETNTTLSNTTNSPMTTESSSPIALQNYKAPQKIGLLLPQSGGLITAGKAIEAGFMAAYRNDASSLPVIKTYDEDQYAQAVSEGANFIAGPLEKSKVSALENSGNIDTHIITLALNNPDISKFNSNVYEFSLSPTDEAQQIANKAIADGYHSALLISPQGAWGENIANSLQKRWKTQGGNIVANITVNNSNDLNRQVQQLLQVNMKSHSRRNDFDVIFLIVKPDFARQIKSLLNYYYTQNIPVYSTSLIYTGLPNPAKDQNLNGIIFCDMPLVLDQSSPWATVRTEMLSSQPLNIQEYIRLYGLGWDAAYISKHFDQLNMGIYGATGRLSLLPQNIIVRTLQYAIFKNGIPQAL